MTDEVTPQKKSWLNLKRVHDQEQEKAQIRGNVVELATPRATQTIIELATEYSGSHDALKEIEYQYQAALTRFRKAEAEFDAMWRAKDSDADAHDSFLLGQVREVELAKAERLARRRALADEGVPVVQGDT